MRKKEITIRDVAEQAGVSVTTVSHVLNGNDDHVGPAKRDHVLEVMQALNYRPNAIARSMITRNTATIGLIINELENALFVPVIDGVNEVLRGQGYHIVLASAPDLEGEVRAIETLRAQQVDGFIFMLLSLRYPSEHLTRLKDEGVPFVVINRTLDDPGIMQIQFDDLGAGRSATEHLLSLGHTRIATISGPLAGPVPRRSALDRLQGWREALLARDLEPDAAWIADGGYTPAGGYAAAQRLLAQGLGQPGGPTALFVASDEMALGALKACHAAGVRVPADLAVTAIGDPPFATYTIPALTTLVLPVPRAGRLAARIVVAWIKAGKPPRPRRFTLSLTLRVRESCGAPARASGGPVSRPREAEAEAQGGRS
ncbi:MAG TPA: LacI family DNA-binding transcriptional regulator [Chloroflexia bacterium]|nr:LacI family DNA-binding transcriptional regulator [Chloroflexia bacterium]